jgi:hypothetical protein
MFDILSRLSRMMNDELRASHKLAVTVPSRAGYNNVMVQRPVIGVGNAPQYASNAFFVGFNSLAGGGTIAGNAPASGIGGPVLNFQTHTIGGPTQRGTLTPSRQYVGLAPQPNFNVGARR